MGGGRGGEIYKGGSGVWFVCWGLGERLGRGGIRGVVVGGGGVVLMSC